MINNRQNGRRRGRGGTQPRNGQAGNAGGGSRLDNRARGNATQLHEKYKTLARDMQLQGDRVMTEYYLQFADHYFRILSENRPRGEEQQARRDGGDFSQRDGYDRDDRDGFDRDGGQDGFDDDGDGDQDVAPRADERPRQPRYEERARDERPREDRQREDRQREDRAPADQAVRGDRRDARPREDRQRDDRPREDRPREIRYREDAASPRTAQSEPRSRSPVVEAGAGFDHGADAGQPAVQPTPRAQPEAAANGFADGEAAAPRRPRRRVVKADVAVNDAPMADRLDEAALSAQIEIDRLPPAFAAELPADAVPANDGDEKPRRRLRRPRSDAAVADA